MRRWEDNIKMELKEIEFGGVDWIYLAQDMDQWRALVTWQRTSGFHERRRNS
jgi:hypothetical protein